MATLSLVRFYSATKQLTDDLVVTHAGLSKTFKRGTYIRPALVNLAKALEQLEDAIRIDIPPRTFQVEEATNRVPTERLNNPLYFFDLEIQQSGEKVSFSGKLIDDTEAVRRMMAGKY